MPEFAPITLGRPLRVAGSESFVFTETEHPPATVLAPHAHKYSAISYVIDGNRSYRFGSDVLECGAGALAFVPAGALHSSHFPGVASRGLMVEARCAFFNEPRRSVDVSLARLCDAIRREIWIPDDVTPLALESLGFELLEMNGESGRGTPPRWLVQVREALHDSFRRPPALAQLAAGARVHRSHLAREFRRHFGTSVGRYVRSIRINHAWHLIARSDVRLCDVAAECGFADQSHLTRELRRAFGRTPRQLRLRRSF